MGAWDWAWAVLGWGVAALGAGLFAWAVWWDRSRGRRRCPRCWYDMAGVRGLVCPECGRDAVRERRLRSTRRRPTWIVLGGLAIGAGITGARLPAARDGWTCAVPMTFWRVVLPLADPPPDPPTVAWMRWRGTASRGWGTSWRRLLTAHRALVVLQSTPVLGAAQRLEAREQRVAWVSALDVLTGAGREGEIALPDLRRLLDSDLKGSDHALVLRAFANLDRSAPAFARLSTLLMDGGPGTRIATFALLINHHRDRRELVDLLCGFAHARDLNKSDDLVARALAIRELGAIASDRPALRQQAISCLRLLALELAHADLRRFAEDELHKVSAERAPSDDR